MPRRKLPVGVTRRVGRNGTVAYQARWRNAAGEVCSYTADTAAEASAYREERLRGKRHGGQGDLRGGEILFADWFSRWMDMRDLRDSTRERDLSYARSHILPAWGTHRLVDIRPEDVERWLVGLHQLGLAPATRAKHLQLFSQCLRKAVLVERLLRNPCDAVTPPRVPDEEMRFLSDDEVIRLYRAMNPWWAATVPFLVDSALRIGELSALRSRHVDTAAGKVRVVANATYVSLRSDERSGRRVEAEPKTRAGKRTVPTLTYEVCELVDELRRERNISPDDLLFSGPKGGPLVPSIYRRRVFGPAVRAAGLAEPWPTPHSLRHTAISLWIATGQETTYRMARWAGHRTTTVFEGRYAHLLGDGAEPVRNGLSARRRQAELQAGHQVEEHIEHNGDNVVDIESRRSTHS